MSGQIPVTEKYAYENALNIRVSLEKTKRFIKVTREYGPEKKELMLNLNNLKITYRYSFKGIKPFTRGIYLPYTKEWNEVFRFFRLALTETKMRSYLSLLNERLRS
ncbi:MAG: hypothetical protein NT030_04790 [Candidatus Saganbacteria bacterium]|nr:hypothetical protein [Candidatus Saganbacteria bacterium]